MKKKQRQELIEQLAQRMLATKSDNDIIEECLRTLDLNAVYTPEEATAMAGCIRCKVPCCQRPRVSSRWHIWTCSTLLHYIKPYYRTHKIRWSYLWKKYIAMMLADSSLLQVQPVFIELTMDDLRYLVSRLPKRGNRLDTAVVMRLALLSKKEREEEFGESDYGQLLPRITHGPRKY